jgi:hypothetical protein
MRLLEYKAAFDYDGGVGTTKLLAHLASCLKQVEARDIRISGNSVSFRRRFFSCRK